MADGSLSFRSLLATPLAFRIMEWVDDLPEFWKPVAFGALFIIAYAIMFGGVITIPIIAAVICFRSATPLAELARLAAILLLAVVGGGLSGLSYTLVGRSLRRVPWIGPFVAGMATAIPYSVLLVLIGRTGEHQPVFAPFGLDDYILLGIVSLLAGGLLGSSTFGPERFDEEITGKRETRRIAVIIACGAVAFFVIWAMCYPPLCWLGGRYCR